MANLGTRQRPGVQKSLDRRRLRWHKERLRRGCGVVVAQEPSKLLGPVRVWSAAPASFLLSKDEILHGRTARRAMPRAFIRPLRQSA